MATLDGDKYHENVLKVFRCLDLNGNGTVDSSELRIVLQKNDPEYWDGGRVDGLMTSINSQKDGVIHFRELLTWLQDKPAHKLWKLMDAPPPEPEEVSRSVRRLSVASTGQSPGRSLADSQEHRQSRESISPTLGSRLHSDDTRRFDVQIEDLVHRQNGLEADNKELRRALRSAHQAIETLSRKQYELQLTVAELQGHVINLDPQSIVDFELQSPESQSTYRAPMKLEIDASLDFELKAAATEVATNGVDGCGASLAGASLTSVEIYPNLASINGYDATVPPVPPLRISQPAPISSEPLLEVVETTLRSEELFKTFPHRRKSASSQPRNASSQPRGGSPGRVPVMTKATSLSVPLGTAVSTQNVLGSQRQISVVGSQKLNIIGSQPNMIGAPTVTTQMVMPVTAPVVKPVPIISPVMPARISSVPVGI